VLVSGITVIAAMAGSQATRIDRLRIDGDRAIWLEGAPHFFFYRRPDGTVVGDPRQADLTEDRHKRRVAKIDHLQVLENIEVPLLYQGRLTAKGRRRCRDRWSNPR
jgi:hypothetical protein